jgi:hypothetical protein
MNVKLLRKVQKHILEEPRRFLMESLIEKGRPGAVRNLDGIDRPLPDCGTAACIAGWVCVLAQTPQIDRRDAEAVLGISYKTGDKLFFIGGWPERFQIQWRATTDLLKRAQIGKRRIDHFIRTHGED